MGENFRPAIISPAKLLYVLEQIAEMQRAKTVRAAFKSPPGGAQHRIPLGAPRAPRGGFKPKEKDDG